MFWQSESDNNIFLVFQESYIVIFDNIIELLNNVVVLLVQVNDINVVFKFDSGLDQVVRYLVDVLGGCLGMKSMVFLFGGFLQYIECDFLFIYFESIQQEVKVYLMNVKVYFDMMVDIIRSVIDVVSKVQVLIVSLKVVINVVE